MPPANDGRARNRELLHGYGLAGSVCGLTGYTPEAIRRTDKKRYHTLLQVINTADAISWCERVLRIKEVRERLVTPDGTCMNAEIEDTRIMLADEMSKIGSTSPATLTGTSVVLNLHVGGFPATPGDTGGDTFVAVSGSAELLQATGRGGVGSPVIASGTGGTVSSAGTSDGVAGNTGRRRETAPIMP